MTKTRILILCCAALLIPAAAFAGNMPGPGVASAWTIYAFANGYVLKGILTSASAMVKNPEFRHLLEFLAMIGLLGTVVSAGLVGGNPGKKLAASFIAATLFLTAGLGTTTDVVIQDTVSGYTVAVPDVPMLVALPEAIVSTAGHELARLMDTFYSVPGDLTVSGGNAFNIAAALTQASTRVQISDPLLRATIAAFAKNCIVPGMVSGRLSAYRLTTSTQLWGSGGTLSGVNPAPLTPVYTDTQPRGVILACAAAGAPPLATVAAVNTHPSISTVGAYEYISQYIHMEAPTWFAQGAGAWAGTAAYSWLSGTLTSAQSYLFGGAMTQSTGESIEQSAAINVLSPSLNAAAIASGQSQSVVALAVAQGEKSQVSAWATTVTLFRDLSGYIYSVLQAFLVAMTPILLAAAFIPGTGWTMVKSYIHITVWLALWMPVLGIINFIVTLYAQGQLGGSLGGTGGYSMQSMALVDSLTSHLVLAAGFLATMTPLITWALVKGSFAFTEFLAAGMGTHMANLAGSIAATGNISLGNQSFDNTSMHQRMMASTTIAGTGPPTVQGTTGQAQYTTQEGGFINKNPAGTSAARSASASQSASIAHNESISHDASTRATTELGSALSTAVTSAQRLGETLNQNSQAGNSVSAAQAAQTVQDTKRAFNTAVKTNVITGADIGKGKEIITTMGVGAGGGDGGGRSLSTIVAGAGAILGLINAGVKQNGSFKNSVSTKANTTGSGGKEVSAGEGASLTDSARLTRDSAILISDLHSVSKNVDSNASQGFKRAGNIAHAAAVDAKTAVTAHQTAQDIASEGGNTAYSSSAASAAASEAVKAAAGRAPAPGKATQDSQALKKKLDEKTNDSLQIVNGQDMQNQATEDANAAQTHTDGGQEQVNTANGLLRKFNTKKAEMVRLLHANEENTGSAATGTSADAGKTVEQGKTAADHGIAANEARTSLITGGTTQDVNSVWPTHMLHPAGTDGSPSGLVPALATTAVSGAFKSAAAVKVAKEAAAAKKAADAAKLAKTAGKGASVAEAPVATEVGAEAAAADATAPLAAAADAAVPLAAAGETATGTTAAAVAIDGAFTASLGSITGLGLGAIAGAFAVDAVEKARGWASLSGTIMAKRIEFSDDGVDLTPGASEESIMPTSGGLENQSDNATKK